MASLDGVLLVDKPTGPTSHDVVARVRRALGTRAVGHAGTLDPMASGLLVVLVGEATKLSAYLGGDDKRYRATVALGEGTDTLDAMGKVTERGEVDATLRRELTLAASGSLEGCERLCAALEAERGRTLQAPPAVSALHVGGERAHVLVRRGETPDLPDRGVAVRELRLLSTEATAPLPSLAIEVAATKGYYVRSLARDLGRVLGVPAHLSALRRLASGAFTVDEATGLDEPVRLAAALRPIDATVARALPCAALTPTGTQRCAWGQRLTAHDFDPARPPSVDGRVNAWLYEGRVVALGTFDGHEGRVVRGFVRSPTPP